MIGKSVKSSKPNGGRAVTLIPGDGVGPEVVSAALAVIEATGVAIEWDRQAAGMNAFRRFGTPVPDALIESLKRTRVALKGPLETRVAEGWRSINVHLRRTFDLYANVRPTMNFAGVHTPFNNVDLIVVRENTEDLYSGIEHEIAPGVVESIKVITARASRRISKFAFEYARTHRRKSVTAIHKANIMKLSDGLFLKCARAVSTGYKEIRYQEQIVDAACMRLVTHPESFDVLLLENLYGDIVSDLCAGLVGGLGLVPGANYGDEGRHLRGCTWHGAGYRGQGRRQSDRDDPVERDDARLPGPSRGRHKDPRRDGVCSARGQGAHARRRRQSVDARSDGGDRQGDVERIGPVSFRAKRRIPDHSWTGPARRERVLPLHAIVPLPSREGVRG